MSLHKTDTLHDTDHVFPRNQLPVSILCAGLRSPPTAAPTRSCHGERKYCNSLCAAGPSPYQPIGSSRPTYSTLNGTGCRNTTFSPKVDATPAIVPTATPPPTSARTTRFSRHDYVPARFNISATISGGGGGDMGTYHNASPSQLPTCGRPAEHSQR
jgi:hypothetical protein